MPDHSGCDRWLSHDGRQDAGLPWPPGPKNEARKTADPPLRSETDSEPFIKKRPSPNQQVVLNSSFPLLTQPLQRTHVPSVPQRFRPILVTCATLGADGPVNFHTKPQWRKQELAGITTRSRNSSMLPQPGCLRLLGIEVLIRDGRLVFLGEQSGMRQPKNP